MQYFLPAHQGRACENILGQVLVKPGNVVPMNYHFTTTKAHIVLNGGGSRSSYADAASRSTSTEPFKGNMDIAALRKLATETGQPRRSRSSGWRPGPT